MRRIFVVLFCLQIFFAGTRAQQNTQTELFCGVELDYSDVNFIRLYNTLVNLTPGTKIHLGHDWQLAAQAMLPIDNSGYPERYNMIRLSMANVTKTFRFPHANQYFKLSAGLFGQDRYGADFRWMYPVNNWLMLNARFGITSDWALGFDMSSNSESTFNRDWRSIGIAGVSVWLDRWSTELRMSGGYYLNKDKGLEGEVMRHFKHCSVSLFGQYHDVLDRYRETVGFRIVMMLPPYKKSHEKVVFRPASNFRLTYAAHSGASMAKYMTDPEENERTYPIRIPWGTGNFDE